MRVNNFIYLCKEGARNLFMNKLMSFACIGVLVACLLLIGSAAMFTLNVDRIVADVEQRNEIVVFLEEHLTGTDIDILELNIRSIENVTDITFVSREEALENLRIQLEAESIYIGILDGLEDDTLLNTYVLRVRDLSLLDDTVARLRGKDGMLQVNAATDVANILTGINRVVHISGLVIVVILIAVSIVIITNTIKLTVYTRRKEINIMKYVGATDTFIRLPFLVEGMLIGLIAAGLSFLILGFGYTYLMEWLEENYAGEFPIIVLNAVDFWEIAPQIMIGFVAIGVFISVVGSGVFVKKYLKV